MALTHRVIKRIDLEHEPNQWIEVRMPSLDILERAAQAQSRKAIGMMSAMAGIDLYQLQGLTADRTQTGPAYDRLTVLQACILAWSYDDPVSPENVTELDSVTADCLMRVLIPQETAEEQKNGSGGSMMPSKVKVLHPKSG